MGPAEASPTIEFIGPVTRWRVGVTGLAGAMMLAGAIFAFSSAPADARPNMVDKAHPCGSCHPPDKPPKK